ncbi:MAG: hypothetical protein J1E79_02580, partial [Rikenella sp.]|nr:hypothetical protein [Rikenella sp.]
ALPSVWALYQGQFGRLFDSRLFIPAAGYRHCDDDTLYSVGQRGYSWSSSVPPAWELSYRAYYLRFYYTVLHPQYISNRANGLQVRCLQK